MAVITASGTHVYIGAAVTDACDTTGEFAAATPYVEIGLLETVGEYGDSSAVVNFAVIGDGRVRKAKGARDAGELTLTSAHDPLDTGQLAMIAAEATKNSYAFKVVIPDRSVPANVDSIHYFRGKVNSKRLNVGTNDNVVRRMFTVLVDSQIYEIPGT